MKKHNRNSKKSGGLHRKRKTGCFSGTTAKPSARKDGFFGNMGGRLGIVLLSLFLFSSCGVMDNLLGKKDKGDEDLMKLLMLGLLAQPAAAQCENNSGFVICIPKGVTFQ